MKRSVVNSGFLPPKKEEKPTLMVGSLGWSPVRSSVGGEAELAALLGPVFGEGLGQLGQREPVGFLAVDQGFHDVGGQSRQLEDAGHIRAIDVEGTGKLADGLDLAGFEDVDPGKGPSQRLEDGRLHRLLRPGDISIQGLGSDDRLAAAHAPDQHRDVDLQVAVVGNGNGRLHFHRLALRSVTSHARPASSAMSVVSPLVRAGGAAHDHAHHPPRGCAGYRKQRIPLHTPAPGAQRDTARRSECMNIGDTAKLTNPQDSGFGRTESAPAGRGPGTARVNTNPEDSPETILRLFVYGTLKRGYWNHQRFCAQARSIEPAVAWGRLYHLHAGFPALEVPEELILARGSVDPLADACRQHEIGTPRFGRPTGDWDLIHGELVTFTDPQRDLPPIDRLEGFRLGGHSMYQRVMVAVLCGRTSIPAWTYWMPCPPYAERVASGEWLRP